MEGIGKTIKSVPTMNGSAEKSINPDMHAPICVRCRKEIPNSVLISQNMLCDTCYNETENLDAQKDIMNKIKMFAEHLQQQINEYTKSHYEHLEPEQVSIKPKKKYIYIDIGSSGKFMIENDRVYGIKGYGVIHHGHYHGNIKDLSTGDFVYDGYTINRKNPHEEKNESAGAQGKTSKLKLGDDVTAEDVINIIMAKTGKTRQEIINEGIKQGAFKPQNEGTINTKKDFKERAYKIGMANGWCSGRYARMDGDFIVEEDQLNRNSFTTINNIDELKEFFRHGNYCLGQAVIYENLCFIQQDNGGDEWYTIKDFPEGAVAFESMSFERMINRDNGEFENIIKRLLIADREHCRKLEY